MAEILTMSIKCADLDAVKAIIDQLKAEKARLQLQLDKVIEALGVEDVDTPCPSNVGLNDSYECGLTIECPQCWRDALEMVVVDPDGPLSPPEIVEAHADGTLCEQCGVYLGGAVGEARLCVGCED